jgi:hypothetical protein
VAEWNFGGSRWVCVYVCVSVCMGFCLKNPVDSWIDGRWRCSVWKERLGGFGGGLHCVKEVLVRTGRSDSRSCVSYVRGMFRCIDVWVQIEVAG